MENTAGLIVSDGKRKSRSMETLRLKNCNLNRYTEGSEID